MLNMFFILDSFAIFAAYAGWLFSLVMLSMSTGNAAWLYRQPMQLVGYAVCLCWLAILAIMAILAVYAG
jgi:hypothetical protein